MSFRLQSRIQIGKKKSKTSSRLNVNKNRFEIISDGDSPNVLIIYGRNATEISVDGKLLNQVDITNEMGYKICDNDTIVIRTDSNWKNLTVV